MKITPVAHTVITTIPESLRGTPFTERSDWVELGDTTDADLLAEFAGRGCYKSWKLPNPDTATNEGYTANVLSQGHYSVFEHATVTFYVEDVSRALLLELERHRHISLSVESQRFVSTGRFHPHPVVPPIYREGELAHLGEALDNHYQESLEKYDQAYNAGRDAGLTIKQSREAARSFLLESTPVDFFVTANIRAWRDVLGKRHSTHADAEIQEFASTVLGHLRALAPNSVQDISPDPED